MHSLPLIWGISWRRRKLAVQRRILIMPMMNLDLSRLPVLLKLPPFPLSSHTRRQLCVVTLTLRFLPTPPSIVSGGLRCWAQAHVLTVFHPPKKMIYFELISWSLLTCWLFERQNDWFTIPNEPMNSSFFLDNHDEFLSYPCSELTVRVSIRM